MKGKPSMKKSFKLRGLGCANCAAKMEERIRKLDGVSGVTVNFMAAKLVIEAEDEKMAGIVDSARAIIHKLEPDVVMEGI